MDIINILICKRRCNYEEFALEFNVSITTIKQDINELSLTYPIYTTQGRNGGINISDGFVISGTVLKRKDIITLIKGLNHLKDENEEYIHNLIQCLEFKDDNKHI